MSQLLGFIKRKKMKSKNSIIANKPTHLYFDGYTCAYDAAGERVWKHTGQVQQMLINQYQTVNFVDLNNTTLYASPYMVVNDHEYTKHYYTEGQRVCSKLGGGMQNNITDIHTDVIPILSSYNDINLAAVEKMRRDFECVGILFDNVQINPASFAEFVNALPNQNNNETDLFFYHSDHIGSSSIITDATGISSQHLQYLPFGELFIEQQSGAAYNTPYKFSGKEKDEETGYSYFGARYFTSDFSIWLNVDPLTDKYPALSSYMYCVGNPVVLKDPDGKDWFRNDESGSSMWNPSASTFQVRDGQSYRNVGTTFSTYSNGTRYDYNQNEVVRILDASPRFNKEGGDFIPKTITADDGTKVKVTFNYKSSTGGSGDKALSKSAVSLLITGINEAITSGNADIKTVDVSTTTTGKHSGKNSGHYVSNGARAWDVDAINGGSVKNSKSHNMVYAIQNGMKSDSKLNENYGPNIQERGGKSHPIDGHDNHIHGSVKIGE